MRHVLTRYGHTTKEWMVCLVINRTKLPYADALVEELVKLEGMTSISININQKNTNVILGEKVETLWGSPYITDYIHLRTGADWQVEGDGIAYRISPQSFYQVNPIQTEKLYSTALDYAGLTGEESVWDLYCGIGTISLFLAQRAKQVYGVEIVPQAIADAKRKCKAERHHQCRIFLSERRRRFCRSSMSGCGGAIPGYLPAHLPVYRMLRHQTGMWQTQLYQAWICRVYKKAVFADAATDVQMLTPDVIVVDPPRKGCDTKCLETIVQMSPKCVVYVSCDSATLARDLKFLCENGYEVKRVRGCDMFGQTVSVETVVLLSQQKPDDTIEIDLDLDELDATSAETKATYQEIKDYVLKEFGLKVSNLYISQIKRKCGIEVGENYNLPKTENPKVPQCPKEKEDAIKAALKYFAMI